MSRIKDYLIRVCEDAGLDPTTEQGMAYAQEMLDAEGVASSDAETRLAETLARLGTLEGELRRWARDYSDLAEEFPYFRGKEDALRTVAAEVLEILDLAR